MYFTPSLFPILLYVTYTQWNLRFNSATSNLAKQDDLLALASSDPLPVKCI